MSWTMPITECVLEEIGFEGLEGITLEGLWKRLSVRLKLTLPLHRSFQTQIWYFVRTHKCFTYFALAEERDELLLYDRADLVDVESGMPAEPEICPYNHYKYNPIEKDGVLGSCETYDTRTAITKDDVQHLSLDAVEEKWGRKLIIVASQQLRTSLLIPDTVDSTVQLSILHYCVLERLGRARHNGSTTHGKHSLCDITRDPVNFHYQKKTLTKNKLIMAQPFIQKIDGVNSSGQLLHLPRFYVEFKPKYVLLTEKIIEILKTKPNCMSEYAQIKAHFDTPLHDNIRKLFKMANFTKFVATDLLVPYRTIYPNASKSEWRMKKKDDERVIRAIQLRDPNMELSESWNQYNHDENEPDVGILSGNNEILGDTLFHQAFEHIESMKGAGVSRSELANHFAQSKLSCRTLIRNLERLDSISSYSCNEGRQKLQRYIVKAFKAVENEDHSDIDEREGEAETGFAPAANLIIIEEPINETGEEYVDSKLASIDVKSKHDSAIGVIHSSEIETKIKEIQKTPFCMKSGKKPTYDKPLTSKMRHRYNLMLRAIRANGFISDSVKLFHMLLNEEQARGFKDRMCKKTYYRLLSRMCYKKQVRLWEITFKYKTKFRPLMFISDKQIDIEYAPIQMRIEQAKKKFLLSLNMERINKNLVRDATTAAKEKQQSTEIGGKLNKKPLNMSKRQWNYGNTPKFVRMRTLHEILYYLVYDQDQNAAVIPTEYAVEQWKHSELHYIDWDGLQLEDWSSIYSQDIGWKMFVQPLHNYHGYGHGWFLLNDLIYRLPLSVFVKICNINYEIPGMDEILSHPIKKHFLVNNAPYEIQQAIFNTRKYISGIDDLLKRMCCMGLLQVGQHRFVAREQVYYYLNRNASLLNTILSAPGYWRISEREYPIVGYTFQSPDDITHYWDDLYKICTNTKLNRKSLLVNEPPVDIHWYRNEKILQCLTEVSNEEALARDCGDLPGDHMGAAGLDSSFFAHLLRNWSFKTTKYKIRKATMMPNTRKGVPIRYNRLVRVVRDPSVRHTTNDKKVSVVPLSSLARRRRRAHPRKTIKTARNRVTVYDDVDREALRRMSKLRVDWNSDEDNFLLLCRVAKLYLGMCVKRPLIVPSVLRDLMQWNCKSMNKTSQACKRRITYILKKTSVIQSMISCLEEVKQNPLVKRRFGPQFATRLQKLYQDEDQFTLAIVIHYVDLVFLLSKQYCNLTNSSDSVQFHLPENIQDFYKIYNEKIDDFQMDNNYFDSQTTEDDIRIATIVTLIHSTMCCSMDKTSWSIQLYEIYKDYPERLLSMAMKKVRSEQLISVNKLGEACHIGKVENRNLPLSAKPYHLSITYQHQMYTKISYDIFEDAFAKLRSIVDIINLQRYQMASLTGIACFFLTEMLHLNAIENHIDIPRQILILDPAKQTADNSSERIYARFQEIFNYIPKFDLVDVDAAEPMANESTPSTSTEDANATTNTSSSLTKLSEQNFHIFCIVNCFGQTKTVNRLIFNEDEKCPLNCVLKQKNPIGVIMKSLLTNRDVWRRLTIEAQVTDALPEVVEIGDTNMLALYHHLLGDERAIETDSQDFRRVLEVVEEILDEEQKQEDDGSLFASEIVFNNKSDIKKRWMGEMINEKIHKFHDFLFVNSCKLSLSANESQSKRATELLETCIGQREKILSRITSNAVLATKRDCGDEFGEAMQAREFTRHETSMGLEISNFIESQRETGVTTDVLKEKFGDKYLIIRVLDILMDLNLVIRCGVKAYTFVYWAFVQPWVINTYNLKRLERETMQPNNFHVMQILADGSQLTPLKRSYSSQENDHDDDDDEEESLPTKKVRITQISGGTAEPSTSAVQGTTNRRLSKVSVHSNTVLPSSLFSPTKKAFALKLAPWIRINGSLNRRVLDKWMATLLLYCIENTGLTISKLCTRFNFLLPVHIRDLLECLEEYGCVKTYVVLNRKPVTLFSSYEKVSIEPATYLDAFDEVIIEPTIDAVTRMTIFIGDKKYKKDFI